MEELKEYLMNMLLHFRDESRKIEKRFEDGKENKEDYDYQTNCEGVCEGLSLALYKIDQLESMDKKRRKKQ